MDIKDSSVDSTLLPKVCAKCLLEQPRTAFARCSKCQDRLNPWCKSCHKTYRRERKSHYRSIAITYWDENKHRFKVRDMSRKLLAKYGITEEEYQSMLAAQDNRCAICNTHTSSLPRRLSVDHCHRTGKIRGLLCLKCNSLLGYAEDNEVILGTAISYLRRAG